jgi:hypothetical protein
LFGRELFIDELVVGHVGEWDLSSGDLVEHKAHDDAVLCMALSGDRIITCDNHSVVRMFKLPSSLFVFLTITMNDEL